MCATLLGAWCLGGEKTWESKEKYIYLLILVCSLNIYMILSFLFLFLLVAWCLGAEKMWESKGK